MKMRIGSLVASAAMVAYLGASLIMWETRRRRSKEFLHDVLGVRWDWAIQPSPGLEK
jgi:hypothetical protein